MHLPRGTLHHELLRVPHPGRRAPPHPQPRLRGAPPNTEHGRLEPYLPLRSPTLSPHPTPGPGAPRPRCGERGSQERRGRQGAAARAAACSHTCIQPVSACAQWSGSRQPMRPAHRSRGPPACTGPPS
eukprot:scaffold44678_cov63-Phaeocystis_antarctica.AAC.3